MKTKTFDCVEMKREGSKKVLEQLQERTIEQQLEYWKAASHELLKGQKINVPPKETALTETF